MNAPAVRRVRRAQALLVSGIALSAVLWGAVAWYVVSALAMVAGGAPEPVVAASVAAIVAGVIVYQGWPALSIERVALWIEEREPRLAYALVTVVEPCVAVATESGGRAGGGTRVALEGVVARFEIERVAWRAVWRVVGVAAVVAGVAGVGAHAVERWAARRGAAVAAIGQSAEPVSRIAGAAGPIEFTVRVVAPNYAGEAAVELRDPSSVTALVGSDIEVRGAGAVVAATVGAEAMHVAADGGGWRARITMSAQPAVLRLARGNRDRLVALVPKADAPPVVVLMAPRADTTVRAAPATIELVAEATDDIGLDSAYFEYIVSAGEEEGSFTSHEGRTAPVAFAMHTRRGELRATLRLGTGALVLKPGSQLSVRAVARDGNDVSGPGRGASETRTLRVARPQEYDSLAIEGAPPPVMDSAFLSQRMVVMQTEALLRRRRRLSPAAVVAESQRLADAESQLRQRVDDILNAASGAPGGASDAAVPAGEPGEREDVDASRGGAGMGGSRSERALYQTAYQAITDAGSALAVARPDSALPHEYVALHALDSARVRNRMYLRGAPPRIVVNIDRVRLSGLASGEKPAPAPRVSGAPADSARRAVARRFAGIVGLLAVASPGGGAVADSLTLLQVDVVRAGGDGSALAEAAAALRGGGGGDAGPALTRARAAIEGPATAVAGLGGGERP